MKKIDLFDEILRKKLEQATPPMAEKHWDLLEQQLDEGVLDEEPGHAAADSKPIDEVIFEKLHSYEAAQNPKHWDAMEVLLNEVFTLPLQVVRYKLAELSIMLLLFVFIWQVIPTQSTISYESSPIAVIQGVEKDKQSAKENTELGLIQERVSTDKPVNTRAIVNKSTLEINQTIAQPSPSSLLKEDRLNTKRREVQESSTISADRQNVVVAEMPYLMSDLSLLSTPLRSLPVVSNTEPLALNDEPSSFMSKVDLIPTLSLSELSSTNNTFAQVSSYNLKTGRKGVIRVGMFGSGEYNHIMITPGLEKSKEEEQNRFAMGYGGGFSIGLDLGRWEIETGAGYAARRYPVGFIYVEGSLEDGLFASELRAGELNIINLPLHLRYNFIYKRNWRAYALTGGALQLAVQAGYNAIEAPEHTYIPEGLVMPVPGPSPAPGVDNTLTRIKEESVGLLEGGAFNDNSYITGNVGIGVERYINDAWSIYVQPTYQHSLYYFREGLGPNKDEINSLSFLIGTKVRLK